MEERNRVEAILFTTGRFLDIEEISRLAKIGSAGIMKQVLSELKEAYDKNAGALEIIEQGNKWKIAIKKEYMHLTENLLTDCELDGQTQKTLAVIAYKTPIYQSDLIKIRGNGAYDHVKLLKELEFVTSEKYGRTRVLKVTQKFYDYFDVVEEALKSKLDAGESKIDSDKNYDNDNDNEDSNNDEDVGNDNKDLNEDHSEERAVQSSNEI